jgi:hypothetical protein
MSEHRLRWRIRRTADGWEGEATLALAPGAGAAPAAVTARARGATRATAASRTLAALDAAARSPLLRAMLPPGAAPAIDAARKVASQVARWFRARRRASVSGYARPLTRREVMRAYARRGAPRSLVRLAGACV